MNMPKDMSCKLSISEIQSYPYQSSCSRPVLSPRPPALPAAILRQKSLQRQTVRGACQNVIPIGFDVAPEVIKRSQKETSDHPPDPVIEVVADDAASSLLIYSTVTGSADAMTSLTLISLDSRQIPSER